MTFEEMKASQERSMRGKKQKNEEHRIQCNCVKWFRLKYRKYAELLYAVPNGSKRDAITGKALKDEGVLAGVSDLNLDVPNRFYHGLRIEMKTKSGRQQPSQKQFQLNVESMGYKYVICRSFDDFMREVIRYMNDME